LALDERGISVTRYKIEFKNKVRAAMEAYVLAKTKKAALEALRRYPTIAGVVGPKVYTDINQNNTDYIQNSYVEKVNFVGSKKGV